MTPKLQLGNRKALTLHMWLPQALLLLLIPTSKAQLSAAGDPSLRRRPIPAAEI